VSARQRHVALPLNLALRHSLLAAQLLGYLGRAGSRKGPGCRRLARRCRSRTSAIGG